MTEDLPVKLVCADGKTWSQIIRIPKTCNCSPCIGGADTEQILQQVLLVLFFFNFKLYFTVNLFYFLIVQSTSTRPGRFAKQIKNNNIKTQSFDCRIQAFKIPLKHNILFLHFLRLKELLKYKLNFFLIPF